MLSLYRSHFILIFSLISLFLCNACQNNRESVFNKNRESFRDKPVQYTKHARCLMGCKNISETDIETVIANGKLNTKESFPADKPCPTYAVEGLTSDSEKVRVIVGECAGASRVITVIDLGKSLQCNCN